MAARMWSLVQIVLVVALVIASVVLIRFFGRFFKRVHDNLGMDAQDRKRTAWRIFGVASAIGICVAVLALGTAAQSSGDSEPVTAGVILLTLLLFGGGSGALGVLQFFFSCRQAMTWYPKDKPGR